ncbi:MAG TPA: SDR family oxidoreductase [Burkholderiales bacterium]|nr:SDR family oxidoreductase [Burkholderiales bacterium]
MSDEFDLSTEIVVLTGGGGILGSRFADALIRHGAKLAILDRAPGKAERIALELSQRHGACAIGFQVDISERSELARARARIEEALGQATVLVNAAATKSAGFFEPFETFSAADWDEVMRTNVTGAMFAIQEFGAPMAQRGAGSIINILSIYGVVAPDQRIYEGSLYEGRAINTPAVYSTSKAALWGLTQYLASYWGSRQVRVNAVSPGGVSSGQNDTFAQRYGARVPLGRMAEGDEICGAVIFLASRASAYVTGQNIVVDGGLSVW